MPRKERQSNDVTQRFAEILKDRISTSIKAGSTQREIADSIGITPSQLSDYLNDKKTPTMDVFAEICQYFEISSDYVLGLNNESVGNRRENAKSIIGLSQKSIEILERMNNRDKISLEIMDWIIQQADKEDTASFLHGLYSAHMIAGNKALDKYRTRWNEHAELVVDKSSFGDVCKYATEHYLSASVQRYKEMIESLIRAEWDNGVDTEEETEG